MIETPKDLVGKGVTIESLGQMFVDFVREEGVVDGMPVFESLPKLERAGKRVVSYFEERCKPGSANG